MGSKRGSEGCLMDDRWQERRPNGTRDGTREGGQTGEGGREE